MKKVFFSIESYCIWIASYFIIVFVTCNFFKFDYLKVKGFGLKGKKC